MNCPKCDEPCDRDSVHNGICLIYGPWGCCNCGWSEDPDNDRTNPNAPPTVRDGYYYDQFGGATPVQGIIEKCARFGLGEAAKKAFEEK